MTKSIVITAVGVAIGLAGADAAGTTIPFTEDFTLDASNWRDGSGLNLASWVAAGGPDGGAYVSTSYLVPDPPLMNGAIVFRGQDDFDSSDDAFTGNWISSGIDEFSFYIRHDGPAPLDVFARFAGSANFPGAVAVSFVPVQPNTWTQITLAISPSSPNIILEGFPFADVFSAVGNVQIGVLPSELFANETITIDLDKIRIAPSPPGLALLAIGLVAGRRKRRCSLCARLGG